MALQDMTIDQSTQPSDEFVPPLENGDHLTRAEFERRYDCMPHLKKAELLEGVVHMPSPTRISHSDPHAHIIGWLWVYRTQTPTVYLNDNTTVRLDPDNEFQPDALLRIKDGSSKPTEDEYLEGPPELVVEIAASSVSYDLHTKMKVYRRNGVQEYIVWRVYDKALDWFVLDDERYVPLQPDENGLLKSRVFPGLWLAVEALLQDDLPTVLQTIQQGVASEAHQAFVQTLTANQPK